MTKSLWFRQLAVNGCWAGPERVMHSCVVWRKNNAGCVFCATLVTQVEVEVKVEGLELCTLGQ